MKMLRFTGARHCATAIALAIGISSSANAAINVSLWTDEPVAVTNATLAVAAGLGAPDATTTVSALNFSTGNSNVTTIDGFLGSSIGGAIGTHALNNTLFLFTGSTFLHAGVNSFVVPHDDGLQLNIDGIGLVVDEPGPTAEVDTPFDVTAPADGLYNFQLSYGECCGGPAVIRFDVNGSPAGGGGGVPEPSNWAMMIGGFGLVGGAMRRRQSKIAVTLA